MQIRYDLNPSRPAGHIECLTHIERFAYIENPTGDLYRVHQIFLVHSVNMRPGMAQISSSRSRFAGVSRSVRPMTVKISTAARPTMPPRIWTAAPATEAMRRLLAPVMAKAAPARPSWVVRAQGMLPSASGFQAASFSRSSGWRCGGCPRRSGFAGSPHSAGSCCWPARESADADRTGHQGPR